MLKTLKTVTDFLKVADEVEAMRLKVPFALVEEYLNERKSLSAQVWELRPVKGWEVWDKNECIFGETKTTTFFMINH